MNHARDFLTVLQVVSANIHYDAANRETGHVGVSAHMPQTLARPPNQEGRLSDRATVTSEIGHEMLSQDDKMCPLRPVLAIRRSIGGGQGRALLKVAGPEKKTRTGQSWAQERSQGRICSPLVQS